MLLVVHMAVHITTCCGMIFFELPKDIKTEFASIEMHKNYNGCMRLTAEKDGLYEDEVR